MQETNGQERPLQEECRRAEHQTADQCHFKCLVVGNAIFFAYGRERAGFPAKCLVKRYVLAHHVILELIHR